MQTLKARTSKYHNIRTESNGYVFDSKLEATVNDALVKLKEKGIIQYFLRQTPLHLAPNLKYVVDFTVFYENKPPLYIDVKGVETQLFIAKKKMVEQLYPIKISIITKKNLKEWFYSHFG